MKHILIWYTFDIIIINNFSIMVKDNEVFPRLSVFFEFSGDEVDAIIRNYAAADNASAEVTGIDLIHFVNLPTATSKYACPSGQDLCNFLTISSPHCANGHANGMCISSDVGE
jgi:hypothetical protein